MSKKREREDRAALAAAAPAAGAPAGTQSADAANHVPSRRQLRAAFDPGPAPQPEIPPAPQSAGPAPAVGDRNDAVTIDRLVSWPLNPRTYRPQEAIDRRALSIAKHGILQSLLVRPSRQADSGGECYEIIAGETRFQALKQAIAGIADDNGTILTVPRDYPVPIRIRDCDDETALYLALGENGEREPMEPLDEARAYRRLLALVAPRPGELPQAAVARRNNVGERTVFRRLRLLTLAPELETMLYRHEINLGQAEAFALGNPDTQRRHLKQMKTSAWAAAPHEIKRAMTAKRIPVACAIFDPALYRGERVADAETGDEWFVDAGEFARLQELALRDKAEELGRKWRWVEIDRTGNAYSKYKWDGVKKTDAAAGAVIAIDTDLRVGIHAPALRKATVDSRRKAAPKGGNAEPAVRAPLTAAQVHLVHAAKTRAGRRAIGADHRAALAYACLGFLGASEPCALAIGADWATRSKQFDPAPEERARILHLVHSAAVLLPDGVKRPNNELPDFSGNYLPGGGQRPKADQAAWFHALYALPDDDLSALFDHLVAERFGSWMGFGPQSAPWLGDSELAVTVAQALDAERHLRDLWRPGAEFFRAYSVDRLTALLRAAEPQHDLRGAKKAELVKLCVASRALTTEPRWFPELRFQSEAAAAAALGGPAPRGGDERIAEAHDIIHRFDSVVLPGSDAAVAAE